MGGGSTPPPPVDPVRDVQVLTLTFLAISLSAGVLASVRSGAWSKVTAEAVFWMALVLVGLFLLRASIAGEPLV